MKRMKELIKVLNEASHAYYNLDKEILSNYEYDQLYDELLELEKNTGIILPDSPTQNVGYEVIEKLNKTTHETPSLSLNKTKDINELIDWIGNIETILSWKMDGLTVIATYENGKLVKAATRGNGYVGEDITHNAKFIKGLPKEIIFKGHLVVRGEAIIEYKDFSKINSLIDNPEDEYKNPRNLVSGTVRNLNSKICAKRNVQFFAFQLATIDDTKGFIGNRNRFSDRLTWLSSLGFQCVEWVKVTKNNIYDVIKSFENKTQWNDFPTDGLVLEYNNITYGESLGSTGKYPRYGIAFKWQDETKESIIRDIFWSASKTGLLNPVAVFDPVEIEGTMVSRASIHNINIMKQLELKYGDTISVYKANMIIPQIAENLDADSNLSSLKFNPPKKCPICKCDTEIKTSREGTQTLWCTSPNCPAKHVGKFERFVERDAMNIEGLSSKTLQLLINEGLLIKFADIYHLKQYKEKIVQMEGMGEISYNNLISAIEKSREVTFESFLYALGIPLVGKDVCKLIGKALGGTSENKLTRFINKIKLGESFQLIDGIGPVIDKNIYDWKSVHENCEEVSTLIKELVFVGESEIQTHPVVNNKTFVITGSVKHFSNREELKSFIESKGGRVSGSVSNKTDYLINNDISSASGKNKKAKELGVSIISEDDFLAMVI